MGIERFGVRNNVISVLVKKEILVGRFGWFSWYEGYFACWNVTNASHDGDAANASHGGKKWFLMGNNFHWWEGKIVMEQIEEKYSGGN